MMHRTAVCCRTMLLAIVLLGAVMAAGCGSSVRRPEPRPELLSLSKNLDAILVRGKLPAIPDLPADQREALLDPAYGYVHDYATWIDNVRQYNRRLESDYSYATPPVIQAATDDPINAPGRLDSWARQITADPPGIGAAFAETCQLLDELPAVVGRPKRKLPVESLTGKNQGIDHFADVLENIAASIDRDALGAIPTEQRKLMGFVVLWICRTSGRFVNHSKNAPTYDMTCTFDSSDPFKPGDATTSLSKTPVPPAIYSYTGLGRYLRSLAGQPVPPGTLFARDEGEHPQFEGAVDFTALRAAVEALATLLAPPRLDALAASLAGAPPLESTVPGVTGTVLRVIETPHGRVIVGGPGPNRYTDAGVLAIIDVGGDDDYIFANTEDTLGTRPLRVIVDFGGDDVYAVDGVGGPAAGILGISVLIDRAGNDRYLQGPSPSFKPREHDRRTLVLPDPEGVDTRLVPYVLLYGDPAQPDEPGVALDAGFAFGAGFLGVGLLIDEAGDDCYLGQKYSFGTGFWSGVGVLHDCSGNDVYAAGTGAIGAGINGAFGLLDDRAGDDHYQCLGTFENSYSVGTEFDNGYGGHGIGFGSSWRVESRGGRRKVVPTLGGGVGLLFDSAGSDSYVGSSFGVASGYAGGMGMAIDLAGNDTWFVKRGPDGGNHSGFSGNHALGNGCHRGVGFLLDCAGNDRYSASNLGGGTAWDIGIGFLIDLGGNDLITDLHGKHERGNTGWGAAKAFAVSYHLGGSDIYERGTFGDASTIADGYPGVGGNFSFFFDIGQETDTYPKPDWNGITRLGGNAWEERDGRKYPQGLGLFVDEPAKQ